MYIPPHRRRKEESVKTSERINDDVPGFVTVSNSIWLKKLKSASHGGIGLLMKNRQA